MVCVPYKNLASGLFFNKIQLSEPEQTNSDEYIDEPLTDMDVEEILQKENKVMKDNEIKKDLINGSTRE